MPPLRDTELPTSTALSAAGDRAGREPQKAFTTATAPAACGAAKLVPVSMV